MQCLWVILFFISTLVAPLSAVEDLVILGSGPAGLTAAIYAARAGLSTLVLEGSQPGGQITLSYQVDNFPGFPEGISGYELIERMKRQAERFGARIEEGEVIDIDVTQRPFVVKRKGKKELLAKTLIIASGASTKWLELPSEKELIGKGVNSCAVCDGILFKGKEVVVIGGGDSALEDALFLANYASKVTIVHRRESLRASKYMQDAAKAHKKIHFVWNKNVVEIADAKEQTVTGVYLEDVHTKAKTFFKTEGVFVAIGHIPNSHLLKNPIKKDKAGYVQTEPFSTKTEIPGLFVAGDVADSHYRQAITAAGTGCMAAMDAYHFIKQQEDKK